MKELINFDDVNNKIITIRNQNVLLDSAVAELYGVETMHINQAVKNNPNKFPEGYIFELSRNEKLEVVKFLENTNTEPVNGVIKNFDNPDYTPSVAYLEKTKTSPTLPKAFTEKGLYMLATILKSERATQTTIAIVEAFAKLKELTNNLAILNSIDAEVIEPEVIEKTGNLFNDLLFSGLPTSAETSVEFNLGIMKGKRKIKYENPIYQSEFDELKKMMAKMNERLDKL